MTAPIQLPPQVYIAGVEWPMYKLVALAVGAVVLTLVGLVTMSLGPAVITAAATSTIIWLALGLLQRSED